ncbi:MAG TPA: hypothetical protein V6D04_09680 [Candidatus Obscuribacterales bacterium]
MNQSDLIQQLRQELEISADEPDEAILSAVRMLKAELNMAVQKAKADEEAMEFIRRAAEGLENL